MAEKLAPQTTPPRMSAMKMLRMPQIVLRFDHEYEPPYYQEWRNRSVASTTAE
jgi:hypothetical protein